MRRGTKLRYTQALFPSGTPHDLAGEGCRSYQEKNQAAVVPVVGALIGMSQFLEFLPNLLRGALTTLWLTIGAGLVCVAICLLYTSDAADE